MRLGDAYSRGWHIQGSSQDQGRACVFTPRPARHQSVLHVHLWRLPGFKVRSAPFVPQAWQRLCRVLSSPACRNACCTDSRDIAAGFSSRPARAAGRSLGAPGLDEGGGLQAQDIQLLLGQRRHCMRTQQCRDPDSLEGPAALSSCLRRSHELIHPAAPSCSLLQCIIDGHVIVMSARCRWSLWPCGSCVPAIQLLLACKAHQLQCGRVWPACICHDEV